MTKLFPFSAIVGQEALKSTLVLNAIDPLIGGVLIRGEKGTAKSTAVRGFSALLPMISTVSGCPYHCDPTDPELMDDACREKVGRGEQLEEVRERVPLVEVPLNATEDRLVGTLSIEHAFSEGKIAFEPGLLAQANRGMLYVDEVNLFPDHLVDMLLDASASGYNVVERDGLSVRHPARFVLIGTMNPEEGELRPQFLDRFGLCVTVSGLQSAEQRRQVVERRIAYDQADERALSKWWQQDEALSEMIESARDLLPRVTIPASMLDLVVDISTRAFTAGHRADIVLYRTSAAIAALLGKNSVSREMVFDAARLALPHRLRQPVGASSGSYGNRDEIDELLRAISTGYLNDRAENDMDRNLDDIDEEILEAMQVPGGPAAGSILLPIFDEKKKPRRTGKVK